jgi:hypothetical protein
MTEADPDGFIENACNRVVRRRRRKRVAPKEAYVSHVWSSCFRSSISMSRTAEERELGPEYRRSTSPESLDCFSTTILRISAASAII